MGEPRSTFLVTGGAGFIGSTLVRMLIGQGQDVITLDALTYAGNRRNLEAMAGDGRHTFVHGSICDRPLVDALLAEHAPDFVINVAAETHVDRSIDGPAAFIETNVVGTAQMLEAVREYGRDKGTAPRYVQVSTDEVYGTIDEGVFTEESPFRANSPYAASKASGDLLVRSYVKTYGMDAVITNGSNTYGPRQFPEKLIPLMVLNAIESKKLPVYGDGRNVRDWLFVEDHARGIIAAARHGQAGHNYNIGGGHEMQNIDLVHMLCAALDRMQARHDGQTYAGQITFVDDRPGHDFRYALSIERARNDLGWQPEKPFDTGFAETIQWYLDNQDWCRDIAETKYARQRLGRGKT
ncbi:MAG: dTDP-glucose 4,6-dehydratase [Rhodospirillales bacterium]|nr:dTDP-glucose 4,6-dehydratase [Rhodospirillales bacterium]MBO6787713.1 dTDP-glucose 4,6-dehydratase [Rhodospirillales bacterium]